MCTFVKRKKGCVWRGGGSWAYRAKEKADVGTRLSKK